MKRDNKVLSLLGNLDIALAGLTLAVLIILTVLGVALCVCSALYLAGRGTVGLYGVDSVCRRRRGFPYW